MQLVALEATRNTGPVRRPFTTYSIIRLSRHLLTNDELNHAFLSSRSLEFAA
jgi:hypothetical protein